MSDPRASAHAKDMQSEFACASAATLHVAHLRHQSLRLGGCLLRAKQDVEHRPRCRAALVFELRLHVGPQIAGRLACIGCCDVLDAMTATVVGEGDAGLAGEEGVLWHPEGSARQRVVLAPPHACAAALGGVDEALAPRALREGRVHVEIHRQRGRGVTPCRRRYRLRQPDREEAELGVAPPQAGEPRPRADGAHKRLQRGAHLRAVRRQRDGAVPCTDLLIEGKPRRRRNLPLRRKLVPPRQRRLHTAVAPVEEALVLALKCDKWPRAAHAVDAAA
mmetsp:Transcript_94556/g.273362  ORF Transcript_94556/g.273362 Transcript_94556/m.273362 type:complete len:277 (+) Transcript_94556:64-894(+)